jgi:hypothetical protein
LTRYQAEAFIATYDEVKPHMNTDIRVLVSFRGHRKRRRLEKIIGPGATGHLIDLWIFAAISRPSGILDDWDADDIADAANYRGNPQELVEALVDTGWLDRLDDGSFALHNWDERQGWVSGSEERSNKARLLALMRHHGEKAFEIAKEKYGIDPAEYGFDTEPMPDACGAQCDTHAARNAARNADAHAARNAPYPYPSQEKDFASAKSGAAGQPKQKTEENQAANNHNRTPPKSSAPASKPQGKSSIKPKPHYMKTAGQYAQEIKAANQKIDQLSARNGKKFNGHKFTQFWLNKRGHPAAVADTLQGVIDYWDSIEGDPWGYAEKIMATKNGNYWEAENTAEAQALKQMPINEKVRQLIAILFTPTAKPP